VRRPDPSNNTKNLEYFSYRIGKKPTAAIFEGADFLIHTAYMKNDSAHPDAYDQTTNTICGAIIGQ